MKKRYGLLLFIAAICIIVFGCVVLVTNRQDAATQAKQIVLNDQAGTNVETDVLKLRAYAASHMKVNVAFTLTGSYNRAVAAAKTVPGNAAMYAAAQASCDKPGVDSVRQSQCVAAYVAANGGSVPAAVMPDITKYQYQFIGPAWSFDLAGIAFMVGALLGIFAIGSVVHRAVTK